jgi:GT2 family glycosyltransferase/glycosyltransferase involved in cell wall biosynthesis
MVLFICYSGAFGGAERLLVQFAGGLDVERFLACPEGPLAQAARDAGMTVFTLPPRTLRVRGGPRERMLSLARLGAHAAEAHSLVGALEPDLVIAWGMRSAIACAAAGLGEKRGRRARSGSGSPPLVFQHNDLLPSPLIGRLVRAASLRADLILALSATIATDLDPDGALGERLQVVLPGVDVSSFESGPVPSGAPEVLVLGAIVDWKRPDLALEAFARVRARRADVRMRLVGAPLEADGSLLAALELRAGRADLAGSVELAGGLADPRPALRRATCLLHCAEREPFGMVVLEALAAGRPAVVPAAGGPAEIVDHRSGLFYAPGDAAGAADALLALLDNPERLAELGVGARERARDFDLAIANRNYAAALSPLMAPQHSGRARTPALAIVTVTHNSAPELAALLRSVERHLPHAHVVVADNGSRDDSVAVARSWSGHATVLALGRNHGFGVACNIALREVHEPVVALLNPDVELLDESLLELARELCETAADERILAPIVVRPDGTRQDSVHPVPTSPADLIRAVIPPAAVPGRLGLPLAPWRAAKPRRVGWAVGCALLARTRTLRELGPFDDQIFLYGEDLELGLRSAAAGVETWFWPTARVLHGGAHSSSAAFGGEPFERLVQARHDVVKRSLGSGRARVDDLAQAVTFVSRAGLKTLVRRPAEREREQLRALAAASGRRAGRAPRP